MKPMFIVQVGAYEDRPGKVVVEQDPTMFELDGDCLVWHGGDGESEFVDQVLAMGPTLGSEDLKPEWLAPPSTPDEFVQFILHNTAPHLSDGVTMQVKRLREKISSR